MKSISKLLLCFIIFLSITHTSYAASASCYADTTDGYLYQTTANGTTVTPTTNGVASNRLPLNTKLWIRYKGVTLPTKVIDRGGYQSLDLTWGLVKLFNIDTCKQWGIREVTTWKRHK